MQAVGAASLVRNTTGLLTSTKRLESATNHGDISEYKGPSIKQYPFRAIRMLGAAQLIVALLIQVVTIVQISIGYGDRYIFLATASVNLWTPLPAIAAGIIGLTTSQKRYWEAQCMKVAYFVLSILSAAVFMMILLFVTGIVESYYFGLSDAPEEKDVYPLPTPVVQDLEENAEKNDKDNTHRALIGTIIALALLELIISFVSVFVACCCAPTYKLKDKALEQKLLGAHDPEVKAVIQERPDNFIPGVIYDNRGVPTTTSPVNLDPKSTVQPRPPPPDDSPAYDSFVRNSVYYTYNTSSLFIVE